MSNNEIIKVFKKYQKTSLNSKTRRYYFNSFEKKMIYRTTKTENPSTSMGTVDRVLKKIATKT